MKQLLCSEDELKVIQENNDKGLYEEKYLPTAVIHNLLRDVRYLIGEVERLQQIEKEYKALTDIIDRARKLAYQQSPDEDTFYMDKDGKLCRRSET